MYKWIRCTCVYETYPIYTFDVHVHAKAIQFIHSMYMRIWNIINVYIRCTCVSENYSIYTFDIHLIGYMNGYSFRIHMYIECMNGYSFRIQIECMNRYSFRIHIECINWIGFVYTCTFFLHRLYKLNRFRIHMYIECINCISMYMCLRKLFNLYIRCTSAYETYSIFEFDVHAYTKPIQLSHTHVHRMYKLKRFCIHMYIECINWISFAYRCRSNASIE
jgi:hypothetical protein